MRLCVVSGTFHPEPGGPPTYLYHLLPELQRRGHAVRVVTYGASAASHNYPYPVTRISRRQPIPLRLAALTRAVWAQARQADAIFVSDYGLPPALANLALRRPLVLKNVGDFAWEFATRHAWIPSGQSIDEFQAARHPWRVRLLRRVQAAYARAAARVIAPSRYSAGLIAGWGVPSERIKVIYNALDPVPFAGLLPRAAARLALPQVPPAGPLCLCVARLAPWKNVGALIRAWPEVRARAPGALFAVVGDGPSRAEWQAQAEQAGLGDSFLFLGALPPAATRLHLRAADLFVLYSRYEGLPHVILEAMAAGTPVVASDAGGNREAVAHEDTGLLVPLDDQAALVEAIVRLLTDRAAAVALARRAAAALDKFSWPRLVDETEALLLEAAGVGR